MSTDILPCKVQPGEEVTFEIGTTEVVKAFVKAVKFYEDGDVTYDLRIPADCRDPSIMTEIQDVHFALVNCISSSKWHPEKESLLPALGEILKPDQIAPERDVLKRMDEMCIQSLPPDSYEQWSAIMEHLTSNRRTLRTSSQD